MTAPPRRGCVQLAALALAGALILGCGEGRSEATRGPASVSESAPSGAATKAKADPSEAPPSSTPEPPPAWRSFVAEHWVPGPRARSEARDAAARARLERSCHGCHADPSEHWRGSQHASAWASEAFQRAFAGESLRFCQGCHAPEASLDQLLTPTNHDAAPEQLAAADLGVACVSCHVEPGEARIWTGGPTLRHDEELGCALPVSRSPAFTGPQACASCHEFEFPDGPARTRSLLMQSTITEHAASAKADESCVTCHMPTGRGHAFPGAYDPAMLARALEIEATREPDALILQLRPGRVGHAVPTGDLFRRLELEVTTTDAEGHEQVLFRRWLGRRFGPRLQGNGLTLRDELGDDRIGPAGRTLRIPVPERLRGAPLRWRLVHQRVAQVGPDPRRARVEGELEMARGEL